MPEKARHTLRTRIATMPEDEITPPEDATSGWKIAAIVVVVLIVIFGFLVYRELGTTVGVGPQRRLAVQA